MGGGLNAYQEALDYLFVRTTGQWRFGLERTNALLDALGNPHRRLRVVHVAGTNGKGSVCATLESVLRARGFRVAKYTSPHLVDFRERLLIDGVPAGEGAVTEFIRTWTPTIERLGATFFEATTAMAFSLFADAAPDIAIVEVGLGGRLDATNVVDPLLSVVTNIGIDHTEYLGETRDAIAREKAGVFKRARAAVIGEPTPPVRRLLAACARDSGAAPVDVVSDTARVRAVSVDDDGTRFELDVAGEHHVLRTGLIGRHQAANTVTALRALSLLPPPFATGPVDAANALAGVHLAGRFDRRAGRIFDVAHNPDGAATLAETLHAVSPARPRVAVFSVLRDKDWRTMMAELAPEIDEFVLTTAPTSPESRRWDLAGVGAEAERLGVQALQEPDFEHALERADERGRTVIITGSFHTVGDAMLRLQVSPHGG